ncbi:MAG: hypothetical protein U0324_01045 [Polyangiales bacterium]
MRPPALALLALLPLLAPRAAAAQSTPAPPAPAPAAPASLTPTLVAQLRFTASEALDGAAPSPLLEVRRLRAGLRGSALGGRLSGAVVLNATPAALELIDAWAEFALTPTLRLRGGQSKQPFTAYRMRSFTELAFVDWALVTRVFGGERQLGFELHDRGAPRATEFSVGLWGGATVRSAHGQGVAAAYGEPVTNLSDLRAYALPDAPHPELTGRFVWRSPREAAVRVDLGVSASVDLRPVEAHDLRAAVAPEAAVAAGPLRLELTGYLGAADLVERPALGLLAGVLAELQGRVGERAVVALRYARVELGDALRADARARADRLVNAAPADQRAALQRRYGDAGRVAYDQELTVGASVRLVGAALSAQADFGWLRTARDAGDRDELRGRAQLQLQL